jgi:Zn-finger nucleic acid-binding protein
LEDVNRWDYVDLPIFRPVGDENRLKESRKSGHGLPVLTPLQLAGPMELWIQEKEKGKGNQNPNPKTINFSRGKEKEKREEGEEYEREKRRNKRKRKKGEMKVKEIIK